MPNSDKVRQIWADPDFHALPIEDRRQIMTSVAPDFGELSPEEQDNVFSTYSKKFAKPAAVAPPPAVRSIDRMAAQALARTGLDPAASPATVPAVPQQMGRAAYVAKSVAAAPLGGLTSGHPSQSGGFQWPGAFQPTPEDQQKFAKAAQDEMTPSARLNAPLIDVGNIPIPFSGSELTGGLLGKSASQLRKEDPNSLYAGAVSGAANVVSGLTAPKNLALLAGLALAPPAIAALANAGLTAEMGMGALESIPEAAKAYKEGRFGDFAEIATQGVASGAMAAGGVYHGVKGGHPAARPVVEQTPEVAPVHPGVSPAALQRIFGDSPAALAQKYLVEANPMKLAALQREAARRGIALPDRGNRMGPAAESAQTLEQLPDYAGMFDEAAAREAARLKGEQTLRQKAEAAQLPPVPETGIPENIARTQDARERIARSVTGKSFDELNNPDRIAIDELITQGYTGAGGASEPVPAPAAPPQPPPPAVRAAHADMLGAESNAIKGIIKSASVGNADAPTVARAIADSGAGSAVLEAASHPEVAGKLQQFPTLRQAVSLLAEHPEASVGADAGHPLHKQAAYDSVFETLGVKPPKPPKAEKAVAEEPTQEAAPEQAPLTSEATPQTPVPPEREVIQQTPEQEVSAAPPASVEPSASRYGELYNQIRDIERSPEYKGNSWESGQLRNRVLELEREMEYHKPAALAQAQAEIDAQKQSVQTETHNPQGDARPYIPPGDLAEHYAASGLDRQQAWKQFIHDTILTPVVRSEQMDAGEFFKAYDAIPREAALENPRYPGGKPEPAPVEAVAPQVSPEVVPAVEVKGHPAKRRAAKKQNLAEQYLSEPVTYGGMPSTRGEMIADLQSRGLSPAEVSAYLGGHETAEQIAAQPKPEEQAPKAVTSDREQVFQDAYRTELAKYSKEREEAYPSAQLLKDYATLRNTGKVEVTPVATRGRYSRPATISTETRTEGRGVKARTVKSYVVKQADGTTHTFDWDGSGDDWAAAKALAQAADMYVQNNVLHGAIRNNGDYVGYWEKQYAVRDALKQVLDGKDVPPISTAVKLAPNPTLQDALDAVADSIPRNLEVKELPSGYYRKPEYSEANAKEIESSLAELQKAADRHASVVGADHPRVQEFQKLISDRRAKLAEEKTAYETAEAKRKEDARVQAEAAAKNDAAYYARFGTTDGEALPDLKRYAQLADWKETGKELNDRAVREFGIKANQLEPLDVSDLKLKKSDLDMLREVKLRPEGDTWVGKRLTQGQETELKSRGWLGDDGIHLTETGERAVLGVRAMDAADAAGRPMSEYKPGTGRVPDPGDGRFAITAPIPYKGDVWHTNGHLLVNGPPPKYWSAPPADSASRLPDISRVMPKESGESVQPVGFATSSIGGAAKRFVYFNNGGAVDSVYYDYINKTHAPDKWTATDPKSAYQAWKGKKLVGLLMPVRADNPPLRIKALMEAPVPAPPAKGHPAARRAASQKGALLPKPAPPKSEAEVYADEMTAKQEKARKGDGVPAIQRFKQVYNEAKAKLVDAVAPIEDTLEKSQKVGGYEIRPAYNIKDKIDRVYRADLLSGQFLKDNGFFELSQSVENDKYFDQYLIARQAKHVAERGIETGRDGSKDQMLLDEFRNREAIPAIPTERAAVSYEEAAKRITDYSRKLLDYVTDSGLISQQLNTVLKQRYPEYVPLQRVFDAVEKEGSRRYKDGPGPASLANQSIIKSLEGSEREIESPLGSILEMTRAAFRQGEKNRAAATLAGYRTLPVFDKLIREVEPGEAPGHSTFSYLDAGKKRVFETTPEIAAAAKSLDSHQLGFLGEIFAVPMRIAKVGITEMNLPFTGANIARDQQTAWVTSPYWKETSVANPKNFLRAALSALKHDKLYEDMVRSGAAGNSFDFLRGPGRLSVEKVRSERNIESRIKYIARNPSELMRAAEDVIGRSEEFTRLQQFQGTYDALIKEGRTPEDAKILAAMAARDNTANFSRRGAWGKPLNVLFLYLNPAIQGGRTHIHAFQRNPAGATVRIATGLLLPTFALTMWNTSDPERKKVYDDIEEHEKKNNFIYIPDGATKDSQNRWNVIKVPMPQGLNELTDFVRKPLEDAWKLDPASIADAARALLGPVSPVDLEKNKIMSEFVPQAIKPTAEAMSNFDFFRETPIVSAKLQRLSPEKQAYPWTSGTAKKLGEATGTSPAQIEHFVKGTFGGLGAQGLWAADNALASVGAIKPEEVNGQNPFEATAARFTKARAGAVERKEFENVRAAEAKANDNKSDREQRVAALNNELKTVTPEEAKQRILSLVQEGKFTEDDWKVMKKLRSSESNPQSSRSLAAIKSQPTDAKVEYLAAKLQATPPEQRRQFLVNMAQQKVLTPAVWAKLQKRIAATASGQ